jgi:broad specificity phosphatase PhoE
MTRLVLLRHAATGWNTDHRLQGRADLPLSDAGRASLFGRRVPEAYARRKWYVSPLQRARETADLLHLPAAVEPALIEMDWGQYEGRTVAELRTQYGEAFTTEEARGLDFQPPQGESPRQVQQRLLPWLRSLAEAGVDCGAVTHKGVIRAVLAAAYGWPMIGKPPVRLDWTCLHEFRIAANGRPHPLAMNIPLE